MTLRNPSLSHILMRMIKPITFALVGLFIAATPSVARAQCNAYLQEFAQWAQAAPENVVAFEMVSHYRASSSETATQMSTYTKGTLDLSTFAGIGFLRGSGKRFVDDREWHQTNCAGGFGAGPFPFDPDATDQLGVSISLLDHRITLTFANGAQRTIQAPQCANGVMYGFSDAPGTLLPGTMYVLSLKRATVPK